MKITPKETAKLLNIFNDIYEELYENGKYDNSYALEFVQLPRGRAPRIVH